MNEAGLDPGIDHMLAMDAIDTIHSYGGKVRAFVSFGGGLPAPENADNALRYKFSWSPKGVLLALLNPVRYMEVCFFGMYLAYSMLSGLFGCFWGCPENMLPK